MVIISGLHRLLFHPTEFFRTKREEGITRPVLLVTILSLLSGLAPAFFLLSYAYYNPQISDQITGLMGPAFLFIHMVMFLLLTGITALITGVFLHLTGRGGAVRDIIQVFCYASVPLALLLLLQSILQYIPVYLIFFPYSANLFQIVNPIISSLPIPGMIWMAIIATRGVVLYGEIPGPREWWGIALLLIILLSMLLYLTGSFAGLQLSFDKGTTLREELPQNETVFPSEETNLSFYQSNEAHIRFLYPSAWIVNTTRTTHFSGERLYTVGMIDPGEEYYNQSSLIISEKNGIEFHASGSRGKDTDRHSLTPVTISVASKVKSPADQALDADIRGEKSRGFLLVNRSPVSIGNHTGKQAHLTLNVTPSESFEFGDRRFTRDLSPHIETIEDITRLDANGYQYRILLTAPAAGYEDYRRIYDDILNTTEFSGSEMG